MRCKGCGIQLSANNMDNCPNCGTPEDRGIKDQLPKGLVGLTMNSTALTLGMFGFMVLVSVLIFVAFNSVLFASLAFLGMLGFVAAVLFVWTSG